MIYYANNGTNMSEATAQNVGWVAPSITPLTNRALLHLQRRW